MTEARNLFGETRLWKDGKILYAENDWILGAYFATEDAGKLGELGFEGPDEVCVTYIKPETAKRWDDAPERRRDFSKPAGGA